MKIICIALLLTFGSPLIAQFDCLDNSHHLIKKYDHKNYHPVTDDGPECLCPCEKRAKLGPRGQCVFCKHYRIPKTFVIVSKNFRRFKFTRP